MHQNKDAQHQDQSFEFFHDFELFSLNLFRMPSQKHPQKAILKTSQNRHCSCFGTSYTSLKANERPPRLSDYSASDLTHLTVQRFNDLTNHDLPPHR
jgi:hypothetical protein